MHPANINTVPLSEVDDLQNLGEAPFVAGHVREELRHRSPSKYE
jgi:hypothetical protein